MKSISINVFTLCLLISCAQTGYEQTSVSPNAAIVEKNDGSTATADYRVTSDDNTITIDIDTRAYSEIICCIPEEPHVEKLDSEDQNILRHSYSIEKARTAFFTLLARDAEGEVRTLTPYEGPDADLKTIGLDYDAPLSGQQSTLLLSDSLGLERQVVFYSPSMEAPSTDCTLLVFGDGEGIDDFLHVLDARLTPEDLQSVKVIGIGTPAAEDSRSASRARGRDYLIGFEDGEQQFASLEAFLRDQILLEGAPAAFPECQSLKPVMVGVSNGAAWAYSMYFRLPDLIHGAIAISMGWTPAHTDRLAHSNRSTDNLFMVSGQYEAHQMMLLSKITEDNAQSEDEMEVCILGSGHDWSMWREALWHSLPRIMGINNSEAASSCFIGPKDFQQIANSDE